MIRKSTKLRDLDRIWGAPGGAAADDAGVSRGAYYEADLEGLEQHYLSPGSHFWVAEQDGVLVGMTGIERVDPGQGGCGACASPRTTGARASRRRCWRRRSAFCREQGYRRRILDTTEQQTAAPSHEKNGFVRPASVH